MKSSSYNQLFPKQLGEHKTKIRLKTFYTIYKPDKFTNQHFFKLKQKKKHIVHTMRLRNFTKKICFMISKTVLTHKFSFYSHSFLAGFSYFYFKIFTLHFPFSQYWEKHRVAQVGKHSKTGRHSCFSEDRGKPRAIHQHNNIPWRPRSQLFMFRQQDPTQHTYNRSASQNILATKEKTTQN